MLHQIPNSPLRAAFIRLVEIQQMLVNNLCALPVDSTVSLNWLKAVVWQPPIDAAWVDHFWTKEKGRRQTYMETVAKATVAAKQELLDIMEEQTNYSRAYNDPPTLKFTQTDRAFWNATAPRTAMKKLLEEFYAPWLYAGHGYPGAMLNSAVNVTRMEYLKDGSPLMCPYCDTKLQKIELDHFLPKSSFPFLSVHPDNLVPACHDSNEGGQHKGDEVPLDWATPNQSQDYLHPRLRPAIDPGNKRFNLEFRDNGNNLALRFNAAVAADQAKIDNMDSMFKLTDFWGKGLESEVQEVQEETVNYFHENDSVPTPATIRDYLLTQSDNYSRYIGKRPLGIFHAELYEFVANDDELVQNTIDLFVPN